MQYPLVDLSGIIRDHYPELDDATKKLEFLPLSPDVIRRALSFSSDDSTLKLPTLERQISKIISNATGEKPEVALPHERFIISKGKSKYIKYLTNSLKVLYHIANLPGFFPNHNESFYDQLLYDIKPCEYIIVPFEDTGEMEDAPEDTLAVVIARNMNNKPFKLYLGVQNYLEPVLYRVYYRNRGENFYRSQITNSNLLMDTIQKRFSEHESCSGGGKTASIP